MVTLLGETKITLQLNAVCHFVFGEDDTVNLILFGFLARDVQR